MEAAHASGGRIGELAARLGALAGWRRRLILALAGASAAAALPPLHLLPVLVVAMPVLVWILDASRTRRSAFGAGWWFGLGYFTAGLYWISIALLTEPEKFAWMIPFAVFGLGGVLACFTGAATLMVRLSGVAGPGRVAVLAGTWTLTEWVRSWIFTGFPWNALGSVWDVSLPVLQFGACAGVYGLTLLTLLAAALPALLADPLPRRARWAALALALALPLAAWAGGSARLSGPAAEPVPGVRLRLVQAAIAQSHKWRDELRQANLDSYVLLSRRPGFDEVTHVIWPETAAPYFLDLDEAHRREVADAAPPGGLVLTGAPRITPKGVEPFRLWNSMVAVGSDGAIAGIYDKVHLVPFGEYVPLADLLPIVKVAWGAVDFSPGPGLRTIDLPGLPPASPLICYEAIFPGAVVGRDQLRPHWLINLTNDAWFGMSTGPYQHLAAARMRAVEEGLPMVRSANTGISAVFDGKGREIARLGLGEQGVLDSHLPRPEPGVTPYGRMGDVIPLALAFIIAAIGLGLDRLRSRRK